MKLRTVLIATVLSPTAYVLGRIVLTPGTPLLDYSSVYSIHATLFFAAFFVLPILVIKLSGEDLKLYSNIQGFTTNLATYVLLSPVLILLFDSHLGTLLDPISLTLTAMNVSAVDFFVHRIYQLPFEELGKEIGILTATAAWFVFHIPEALYLSEFSRYSFPFMLITGILFALVYSKTKDVTGLMVGHVLLNVIISL